jgi:cytoskeleton protein RodZ
MIGRGIRVVELGKSLEHPEAEVGTFGERLRREREMREISLEEIAAVTKIGTRLLRALEDEQFDQLPGGIFNKGYIRAYAKYVGIDEEQAVADYLQAAHEATPGGHLVSDQNTPNPFERATRDEAGTGRRSTLPVVPVLITLVLVAGIAGGWRVYRERQFDRAQQRAAITVMSDTRASTPGANSRASNAHTGQFAATQPVSGQDASELHAPTAPTSLATGTKSVPNSEGATEFELTVRPRDSAWVSIKADGKFVVRGIIKPPEVKTIHATSQVVFWTGNAGAVEVLFNGKSVPLTGGENEERVLVFNSHGLLPSSASQ